MYDGCEWAYTWINRLTNMLSMYCEYQPNHLFSSANYQIIRTQMLIRSHLRLANLFMDYYRKLLVTIGVRVPWRFQNNFVRVQPYLSLQW